MNTKALKQKILDLAIHGKLLPLEKVEKIRKEEPASVLLEKIRAEKQEKIAKGELKKDKNDSFIFVGDDKRHYEKFADGSVKDIEDEIPFDMPDGWSWCRLGNVCKKLVDGNHNPPKGIENKTDYLMLSSRNINSNTIVDLENVRYLTKEMFEIENKRTQLASGDILFTSVGSLGRSCIFDGVSNFCFQRSVTVIDTNIFNNWVKYFFDSNYYQDYVIENATGTAQLGFYMQQMSDSFIVVPPLAEQQLIVAEIEKIFAQIDLLEQNKSDLQTAIKQAKSKILDLAIHGKLVPQDTNDEPASVLLEKIRTEKEEKIAKGELKRDKNDSFIYKSWDNFHYQRNADGSIVNIEDEIPFDIPDRWAWCRLGEIYYHTTGKALKKTNENGTLRKYITTSNLYWNRFDFTEIRSMYFTEEELEKCTIKKGDLVLCNGGDVGRAAIWTFEENICYQNHVSRLRPKHLEICNKFYLFLLMLYKELDLLNGKGVGISSLSASDLLSTIFPLPPLAEQQRIVAKIEELFSLLDSLENNLV